MHQKNLLEQVLILALEVSDHFVVVAVTTERVDLSHIGFHFINVAMDRDLPVAPQYSRAKCLRSAVTHCKNCICRI